MSAPYDRHAFITDLIESGFTSTQAEVLATGVDAFTRHTALTRGDFDVAMTRMDGRLKEFEARVDGRFERILTELSWLKWTGGPLLLIILGFLVTLVLRR